MDEAAAGRSSLDELVFETHVVVDGGIRFFIVPLAEMHESAITSEHKEQSASFRAGGRAEPQRVKLRSLLIVSDWLLVAARGRARARGGEERD